MLDLKPIYQTILTLIGLSGLITITLVYFRSRYTQELISSLKDLTAQHEIEIKHLKSQVATLNQENNVLKTIPLGNIESTQLKILHLIETQNQILGIMKDRVIIQSGVPVSNP